MNAKPAPVTSWSWSRYADYKQCPLRFKLKYIDKLPDPGSKAMDRGNKIHKLAEDYTKGVLKTLPPELKNFKKEFTQLRKLKPLVEQEWGFKRDWSHTGRPGWFGDDVWLRAKCDVAIVYDDNTGEAIDHKTGRRYETNKDQVGLFAVLTGKRFPHLDHLTTRLWYLDIEDEDEKEVIEEYTRAELILLEKDWEKNIVPMFTDRKFAPRPNDKCGWCVFSKAKGGPCKF